MLKIINILNQQPSTVYPKKDSMDSWGESNMACLWWVDADSSSLQNKLPRLWSRDFTFLPIENQDHICQTSLFWNLCPHHHRLEQQSNLYSGNFSQTVYSSRLREKLTKGTGFQESFIRVWSNIAGLKIILIDEDNGTSSGSRTMCFFSLPPTDITPFVMALQQIFAFLVLLPALSKAQISPLCTWALFTSLMSYYTFSILDTG